MSSPGYQAITGLAKLMIVVGYLLLIRRIPEVLRVFQYHGAEHKAISTYKAKVELVVDNARSRTRMHARCGTTFLVIVALVSIVVFTMLGAFFPKVPGGRLVESVSFFFMKLPLLPLVAAITYELQRLLWRSSGNEPCLYFYGRGSWFRESPRRSPTTRSSRWHWLPFGQRFGGSGRPRPHQRT